MKKILIILLILFTIAPISLADEPQEIQFIYINGSNNNDKKMKKWFYDGMTKMHNHMYNTFLSSPYVNDKLLKNGQYTIAKEPEACFWGDKSSEEIDAINSDLKLTQMFSPKLAQTVRKLLAHCLHDAIWVSHYRNMHPVLDDLHSQVMKNYEQNKPVILLGYSAGAFVTYEYIFNKFSDIDVYSYFNSTYVSEEFKSYIKANPKQPTCIDALIRSKLAVYSADGKLVPNVNPEISKQLYDKLDEHTCSECIPSGAVKGIINFASPLVLFYSDISNPAYPLTLYNKLLYKYLLENDIFWLTVNFADDPLGYPTTKNISYSDLKDKLKLEIMPNNGFLYSKSDVKSRRTFIGAHTSYWACSKKFSKAVVEAYIEGYELYNSNDL